MEEQAFYIISGNPQSLSTFAPRKVFSISLGCDVHLCLPPQTLECQPGLHAAPFPTWYTSQTFVRQLWITFLCCDHHLCLPSEKYNILGPQLRLYAYFDAIYATLETPDAKAHTYITQCLRKTMQPEHLSHRSPNVEPAQLIINILQCFCLIRDPCVRAARAKQFGPLFCCSSNGQFLMRLGQSSCHQAVPGVVSRYQLA